MQATHIHCHYGDGASIKTSTPFSYNLTRGEEQASLFRLVCVCTECWSLLNID